MDKPRVTPKDFFLWAGAMIALYWTVVSFIFLVFNYIDYAFPGTVTYSPVDPYQSGVGHEMASIIVLFPIYVVIMLFIRRDIHADHTKLNIWVRRWALILTLFVTALTIAIDLITLLTTFFNGETFATSFVLKAVLVLLVAAGGFMHFIADFWGFWDKYPDRKRSVFISVSILLVLTIISGFIIIGTPAQALRYRFDEQRVSDLQTIQSEVVTYWQQKGTLPPTLNDIADPLSGTTVPTDPQTGTQYSYSILSNLAFKLCAEFSSETASYAITEDQISLPMPAGEYNSHDVADSWYHEAGNQCFTRNIDPARYPIDKTQ